MQTIQQAKKADFKYCKIVIAYNLRHDSSKLPALLKPVVNLYRMGQNVHYYTNASKHFPTKFHKLMLLFWTHKTFTRCYSLNVNALDLMGLTPL